MLLLVSPRIGRATAHEARVATRAPIFTEGRATGVNRERLVRTLTFWLRPAFASRVINRLQKIVGFGRSTALASSA